ncbi:acyl-CoA reductase [Shewanella sp. NFH-SH190041]|uniref:acyl-CoA reductase n=1 Tax=Shewanella sp. NFH-SH190041 TaxID=2950245 RepID=UPI0021C3D442|nr:acyl-CoA reductase [Shewanella sp. NFH-SH190041]BDM63737.1 acyl-CoA reductase [Shewanella sp. NFH-SH190041]
MQRYIFLAASDSQPVGYGVMAAWAPNDLPNVEPGVKPRSELDFKLEGGARLDQNFSLHKRQSQSQKQSQDKPLYESVDEDIAAPHDWQQVPEVEQVLPGTDWQDFTPSPLPAFAPEILSFLAHLSQRLIQAGTQQPDLAALGFLLRPAQLAAQQQRLGNNHALGLVFHLVPSNVPVVAFYSWAIALLLGNANVVRLSSKRSETQQQILAIVQQLLTQRRWQDIARRNRFIRYRHSDDSANDSTTSHDEVTAWFSARCRLRVIWGGDNTVGAVRAVPLAPRAAELVFADRQSIAVLDSRWLRLCCSAQLAAIAAGLQQDCCRFNQQACSSPTGFIWLGQPEPELRKQLLQMIFAPFAHDAAAVMQRLVGLQQYLCLSAAPIHVEQLAGVNIVQPGNGPLLQHAGGGVIAEWVLDDAQCLLDMPWDIQTCVLAGDASLRQLLLAQCGRLQLDRVVRPGQALALDWYWDGMDLPARFSRSARQG